MPFRNQEVATAFGIVLRRNRKAADLTQRELAHIADTHANTISIFERGHSSPGLDVVIGLAEALDLQPDVLVRETMDEMDELDE